MGPSLSRRVGYSFAALFGAGVAAGGGFLIFFALEGSEFGSSLFETMIRLMWITVGLAFAIVGVFLARAAAKDVREMWRPRSGR